MARLFLVGLRAYNYIFFYYFYSSQQHAYLSKYFCLFACAMCNLNKKNNLNEE